MGADRVISYYQELLPVALRDARPTDSEHVYQWNCSAEVRALSREASPVSRPQHSAWFRARLGRPDPMWIVEEGGHAVGVVRVDRAEQIAKISIALAPYARGRGIGRRAIVSACLLYGAPIVAEIQDSNTTSRECFEACGFKRTGETGGFITYTWSP